MSLIENLRCYLEKNNLDYLLVNSTNEYLVEYSDLSENARYFLTNFSGSTGDAVISAKHIWLFVDGRYHQQADLEVDKKIVTVVKMKIGETFNKLLVEKIKPDKTFAIVATKNSQARLEGLEKIFKEKNIQIKLLNEDPVMSLVEEKSTVKPQKLELIDKSITGRSSDEKIKLLSENLSEDEAFLITNLEEVSYLCNLRDFSTNYSSKIKCKCLITKDFCWKCPPNCNFSGYINRLNNISKIFVDRSSITALDYQLLGEKAVPLIENPVKEMKSVKTKEEIEHYKECFRKTDEALSATRDFILNNDNISEFDIAQNLEANFYKFGAKSLSFKSIVAKDKNAALAHYSKCSKEEILKDGSLVLIDCGGYYEGGLATDITRVFVKGKPSKSQKEVYTRVLQGFLKAFNKRISDSTTGFEIDKTARKLLNENKPAQFEFSHSLGHGIGISVHESPPSLSPSEFAKVPLKHNMCFTIEPGLYNPKIFGIRLENSCYLDEENGNLVIKSFSNMCFEEKLIDYELLTAVERRQLKQFEVK